LNKAAIIGTVIAIVFVTGIVVNAFFFTTPLTPFQPVSFQSKGVTGYIFPSSNLQSSISTRVGETFIVQLTSSGDYEWIVTTSDGIHFLNYTVVGMSHQPAGEVRNYFFTAVRAGSQTITLQHQHGLRPKIVSSTIKISVSVS